MKEGETIDKAARVRMVTGEERDNIKRSFRPMWPVAMKNKTLN